MPARLIAIGDIHGCLAALQSILEAIAPAREDTIIMLGDYIDRGPDSRGVLDYLIRLRATFRLVPILGNHDALLIDIRNGQTDLIPDWVLFGGNATLLSYDTVQPEDIPSGHIEFLEKCSLYFETDTHIFLHGTYDPSLPMECQLLKTLIWDKIRPVPPGPHCSGKTVIVGHTAQRDGKVFDLGYLKCIDTCCYGEGYLTALDVHSSQIWQADKTGKMNK